MAKRIPKACLSAAEAMPDMKLPRYVKHVDVPAARIDATGQGQWRRMFTDERNPHDERPEEFACLKGKVSACPMARLRYVNWRHAQAHALRRAPEEKRFPMTG
jgi:hypothetical protein